MRAVSKYSKSKYSQYSKGKYIKTSSNRLNCSSSYLPLGQDRESSQASHSRTHLRALQWRKFVKYAKLVTPS